MISRCRFRQLVDEFEAAFLACDTRHVKQHAFRPKCSASRVDLSSFTPVLPMRGVGRALVSCFMVTWNSCSYRIRCGGRRDALERLAGRYPMRGTRKILTQPVDPETARSRTSTPPLGGRMIPGTRREAVPRTYRQTTVLGNITQAVANAQVDHALGAGIVNRIWVGRFGKK